MPFLCQKLQNAILIPSDWINDKDTIYLYQVEIGQIFIRYGKCTLIGSGNIKSICDKYGIEVKTDSNLEKEIKRRRAIFSKACIFLKEAINEFKRSSDSNHFPKYEVFSENDFGSYNCGGDDCLDFEQKYQDFIYSGKNWTEIGVICFNDDEYEMANGSCKKYIDPVIKSLRSKCSSLSGAQIEVGYFEEDITPDYGFTIQIKLA